MEIRFHKRQISFLDAKTIKCKRCITALKFFKLTGSLPLLSYTYQSKLNEVERLSTDTTALILKEEQSSSSTLALPSVIAWPKADIVTIEKPKKFNF